jgi:hypothetical protein
MDGVADEHHPVAMPVWNGRHDVDRAQDLKGLLGRAVCQLSARDFAGAADAYLPDA